jgi:hypothetical protein
VLLGAFIQLTASALLLLILATTFLFGLHLECCDELIVVGE